MPCPCRLGASDGAPCPQLLLQCPLGFYAAIERPDDLIAAHAVVPRTIFLLVYSIRHFPSLSFGQQSQNIRI